MDILYYEIDYLKKTTKNLAIRLNVLSDLSYEKFIIPATGKNIFDSHKDVQFYDYTKNPNRNFNIPNYHLTFSRSEVNEDECNRLMKQGVNVAIVFKELPKRYKGKEVINGDEHDLRFLDKKNVIVGLRAKGIVRNMKRNKFMVQ